MDRQSRYTDTQIITRHIARTYRQTFTAHQCFASKAPHHRCGELDAAKRLSEIRKRWWVG